MKLIFKDAELQENKGRGRSAFYLLGMDFMEHGL